jgi:hypothetical protein
MDNTTPAKAATKTMTDEQFGKLVHGYKKAYGRYLHSRPGASSDKVLEAQMERYCDRAEAAGRLAELLAILNDTRWA